MVYFYFFIFDVFSTYTELNPEPIIDTTIKFTLITKRGNKQQVSVWHQFKQMKDH